MPMDLPGDPKLWPDDPLDRGLVGEWRFDRDTGLMLPDSSGYGRNGTVINGASWVTTDRGLALDFVSAGTQRIDIDDWTHSFPLTLEAFFKPDDTSTIRAILELDNSGASNPYCRIVWWSDDNIRCATRDDAGLVGNHITVNPYTPLEWHNIIYTVEPGYQQLWINGVAPLGSTSVAFGALTLDRSTISSGGGGALYFDGQVASIRIYKRIFTASEAAARSQRCLARASGAKSLWMIPFIIPAVGPVTYTVTVTGRAVIKMATAVTAAARAAFKETAANTAAGRAMLKMVTTATAAGQAALKETAAMTAAGRAVLKETAASTAAGRAFLKMVTSATMAGRAALKEVYSVTAAGYSVLKETASATAAGLAYLADIGVVSATAAAKAVLKETSTATAAAKAYLQDIGVVQATAAALAVLKESASNTAAGRAAIKMVASATAAGRAALKEIYSVTAAGLAALKETASQTAAGRAVIKMTSAITAAAKAYLIDRITNTAAFRAVVKHTSPVTAAFRAYLQSAVVKVDFTLEPRPDVLYVEPRPDVLYVEER